MAVQLNNMSEESKIIKKDIVGYAEMEAVANSAGGKRLIKSLLSDINGSIEGICHGYREMPHFELISLSARLSERLALLRVLTRAKKNKNSAKDALSALLKDEIID